MNTQSYDDIVWQAMQYLIFKGIAQVLKRIPVRSKIYSEIKENMCGVSDVSF